MSYNQHLQIHAPGPALCCKTQDERSPPAPLPQTLRLCSMSSLWSPAVAQAGVSVVVVAAQEKGTPFTLLPLVGWELPDTCSLCISRPYRGAWRSSWAILSRVTRRPPGTWGSWRTRGARGSVSTLITLEEVHTDMVRRSSVGKGRSQGVHNTCTASLDHQHPGLCCPRGI